MLLASKKESWFQLKRYASTYQEQHTTNSAPVQHNLVSLDYSKQRISPHILDLLINLANESDLTNKIDDLLKGKMVNLDEQRAALHTALRLPLNHFTTDDALPFKEQVFSTRVLMCSIAEKVRAHEWLGYSGKPVVDIVNIGIGGSDLGPRLCVRALSAYANANLNYHFISEADPYSLNMTLARLNPETTLFIISSKSFETQETILNAHIAREWMNGVNTEPHFIAVTAQIEKAKKLGFKHILPIWDWVGGRFSFCSAINLITMIAIGSAQFEELLRGAHEIDEHYKSAAFIENIPVLLALIGIWNINFQHINTLLILPYFGLLDHLVPYIQQLDMESNGKSIDNNNHLVDFATGPIIWGGSGNQAQHSYYQLLCQGTHKITADLISINSAENYFASTLCKAKIQVLSDGVINESNPKKNIEGKMPLNHLALPSWSPQALGALIALYEHKIYTQSVIWNINPFNQPGVDSTKLLQKDILFNHVKQPA